MRHASSWPRASTPRASARQRRRLRATRFAALATEWLELHRKKLSAKTFEKAQWTFETLLCPVLGELPIRTIDAPQVLAVLRKIEARGRHETAHRTKQRASQVLRSPSPGLIAIRLRISRVH